MFTLNLRIPSWPWIIIVIKFYPQRNILNADPGDILGPENNCEYVDLNVDSIHLDTHSKVHLNVLHINIRSVHKNKDNLLLLLDSLAEQNIVVHVIALCETFLTTENCHMIDLNNYSGHHQPCVGRFGGGVSLYLHKSVKLLRTIELTSTMSMETIFLEISYSSSKFVVGEMYRPPNTNVNEFMHQLESLLDKLKDYPTVIVCTDQNLDLLKIYTHQITANYLEMLMSNLYVPSINKPTRVTYQSCTLIDNVYLKIPDTRTYNSFVVTDGMSDHFPCLLSMGLPCRKFVKSEFIEKRKLNDAALCKIRQGLLFTDWSVMFSLDLNTMYDYLIDKITNELDVHAPKKVVRITSRESFSQPWMHVKLLKYNSKCRKLYNKARLSESESDYKKYRLYRQTLVKLKRYEKVKFYDELFKKIGKNSKNLWSVMNGLIKGTNNKTEVTK